MVSGCAHLRAAGRKGTFLPHKPEGDDEEDPQCKKCVMYVGIKHGNRVPVDAIADCDILHGQFDPKGPERPAKQ